MKLSELKEIPTELPFSSFYGTQMLLVLKSRAEYLGQIINEKELKGIKKGFNYNVAELSALMWTINNIIELEQRCGKKDLESLKTYQTPNIPQRLAISGRKGSQRLKRLRSRADYLQIKLSRWIGKDKDLKKLNKEEELSALIWAINQVLRLEELCKENIDGLTTGQGSA